MKPGTTPLWSRTILVEKGAQIALALRVIAYLLAVTIVALGAILFPSVYRVFSASSSLQEQLAASREFLFVDLRVVPVLLGMMVVVTIHFLFLTNRVFGPIWRLTRVFRRWRGERAWPPPLSVRRRDFHQELFAEISQTTEALGQDLRAIREQLRTAAGRAGELARGADPGGSAAEALRDIEARCRGALERVDRWQP